MLSNSLDNSLADGPKNPKEKPTTPFPTSPIDFQPLLMDISQLNNLRHSYEELERRVQRALNTQVGDSERLAEVQSEVLSYSQAVERVRSIQPAKGEFNTNALSNIARPSLLT